MKTAPAPFLHFSGYPLPHPRTDDKQPSYVPDKSNMQMPPLVEYKEGSVLDIPENWDDAWFANYE